MWPTTCLVGMDTLSSRLSWARGLADPPLSQRALSRLADLAESHVGQLEQSSDHSRVAFATIEKLASVIGVDARWLLNGAGEAPAERTVRRALKRAIATSPQESNDAA